MKKLTTLLLAVGVTSMASAQVINTFPWTEDFEAQPNGPTGCGPSYNFAGTTWENGDDAVPASPTHQVDYTVDEGGTSSSGTGPSVDHTLGTNVGHYIYAETSCNGTGYSNREFSIISPYLDFTSTTGPQLGFWYHMLGGTQGNLRIYVDQGGSNAWTNVGGPITDNIDLWQEATVSLSAYSGMDSIRVRFEYISGTSFTGDMALDDISIFVPEAVDVAALAIQGLPSTGCGLDSATATICFVQNGSDTLPIGDTIWTTFDDGTTMLSEFWIVNTLVLPGDTVYYTYSQTLDYSIPGLYTGYASASYTSSLNSGDDTVFFSVNSLPEISTFPYRENFDNGTGGFIAYNNTNGASSGTWAHTMPTGAIINTAASDSMCFKTGGAGGLYNAGENSFVESPCFNFTNSNGDEWVGMNVWWESEISWDGANLQYTNDGGATWNLIGNFGDPHNWYTDNTINGSPGGSGIGWTGRDDSNNGSGGWVFAKHPLDSGVYGQQSVIFRVYFGSDGSVQDEGFAFDDFTVASPPNGNIWPMDTLATCSAGDTSWVLSADTTMWSQIDWITTGNMGGTDTVYRDTIPMTYVVELTDSFDMCDRDTVTIAFVDFIPPMLGGDVWACVGDTVMFDAGSDNLTTYTYVWDNGDSTQMVTSTMAGSWMVTKTDSTGRCWASDSAMVMNTAPIGASGDTTGCDGDVFTIMADGGASWLWGTGETTQSIVVNATGDIPVGIVDTLGCLWLDTVSVVVNALPTVDLGADQTICANHIITLDATTAGATYLWSPGGETTATIDVDGADGTDTYSVTITDGNGCSGTDDVLITVDPCTGIGEIDGNLAIEYFPNPTTGQLTVNVQDLNQSDLTVTLYDVQGRAVFSKLIPANGSNYTVQMNLGDVAQGVYQVRFDNGTNAVVSKLVVR